MEWEVWLRDGTRRTSRDLSWGALPDGIVIVRWWGPHGKGMNWGDGLYGDPATHKEAGLVSDEVFAHMMHEAYGANDPPSKR